MDDTLDDLAEHAHDDLRPSLAAFRERLPLDESGGDVWTIAPLRDLPGYATDAVQEGVPAGLLDDAREAHHLGVLHAWHVERGDVDADDARLRGLLFERWRDALVRVDRSGGVRVVDRVTQAMRWLSWGRSNAQMAERAGRWTLQEYQRSLRWRTCAQGLAALVLVERVAPAKRAAFERTYAQLVLGLSQTTSGVARGSTIHQLLHCDRADLVRSGLLDIQIAIADADAAGFTRLGAFCRAHAEATEELHSAERKPAGERDRSPRSKRPTVRALKSQQPTRSETETT